MTLQIIYDTLDYANSQLMATTATLPNVICFDRNDDITTFYVLSHACGGALIEKKDIPTRDIHQIVRLEKRRTDIDHALDRMLNEMFPYHYYIATEKGEQLKPFFSEMR